MAKLDSKKAPPKTEESLADVAQKMAEFKADADRYKKAYDDTRKQFLALLGDKSKFEDDVHTFSVARPVITTFDGEGLHNAHPEADFLLTIETVTTYALNEKAAQKAIESDDDGLVLALIKEFVTETPGSPRVTIKVKSDE